MELRQHPEYHTYRQHKATDQRYRQAIGAWKACGAPIETEKGLRPWTFERTQALVNSLVRLFQAYNQVLWEQFPYCQPCCGGCCVVGAVDIKPFDWVALALLGQAMPTLPERIGVTERHCIYLTETGCAWPASSVAAD